MGPLGGDRPPGSGHYFSETPVTRSRPHSVRLDLPDRSIDLTTDRGVFSPTRVDPGTKLLLMELPAISQGPVVDVGCGYGPIAVTIALRHPDLEVVAVDVNERARALCAANAAATGAEVTVLAPSEVPDDLRVATIVSNPPIRIGKEALHGLLASWFDRLEPGGHAYLVVNRNLGADSLVRWMTGRGLDVERLRSRQGYRVLDVVRPD